MHAEDGLPPIPRAVASQQNLEIIMLVKDVQNLPGVLPVQLSSPLSRAPQVQCAVVCCSMLQCVAARCSMLQRVAACRSVSHSVATCCSVLLGVLSLLLSSPLTRASQEHSQGQCVALSCSALQCVAGRAASAFIFVTQHSATSARCCSVMQ